MSNLLYLPRPLCSLAGDKEALLACSFRGCHLLFAADVVKALKSGTSCALTFYSNFAKLHSVWEQAEAKLRFEQIRDGFAETVARRELGTPLRFWCNRLIQCVLLSAPSHILCCCTRLNAWKTPFVICWVVVRGRRLACLSLATTHYGVPLVPPTTIHKCNPQSSDRI
jgi:hypothetical protein